MYPALGSFQVKANLPPGKKERIMPPIPLSNTKFNLNSSGVAGFFGGEEAVSAMGTVHFYRGQKWLGWYNSPGSYHVAKQYGKLANNRFWDGLFPGKDVDPAEFFELNGQKGPEFISWGSGTHLMTTGHIAQIFASAISKVKEIPIEPKTDLGERKRVSYMSIVDLGDVQEFTPNSLQRTSFPVACATMLLNIIPCAACGVFGDWYCFSMIVLGIIANAFSCYVIGSGKLQFHKPKPSLNSPRGDGILKHGSEVIILRGKESPVAAVTSGNFTLTYPGGNERTIIGLCSLFQYAQFLAQLLLIPQGKLFGQVMFLTTFAVSWVYNCYLSSKDKEKLQHELIMNILDKPKIRRYKCQTRTTMVVLALLALDPPKPNEFLKELLPSGTPTWDTWRENVLERFISERESDSSVLDSETPSTTDAVAPAPATIPTSDKLLTDLLGDVETAYQGYEKHAADLRNPQTSTAEPKA
ncbi:hypothetical protein BDZ94DRAFT_1233356 [Collybia nuda]|uniref:Uncharacterized protein n=1 Tax=Collybia nuda TaxID=64659 RepID=A0A9P5YBS3_9AGAR|nr:hypothetical protein BDZ94DRAFT_1233356 [Collybia nuda]